MDLERFQQEVQALAEEAAHSSNEDEVRRGASVLYSLSACLLTGNTAHLLSYTSIASRELADEINRVHNLN